MTFCQIHLIQNESHQANTNIHENYCNNVNLLNILQSFEYTLAMKQLKNQNSRTYLIKINNKQAGFARILEIGLLKNLIHAVILDRGPVWFDGFGSAEDFKAFITAFKSTFPKRFGRRIRLIPEIEDSPEIRDFLIQQGYKRTSNPGYQTAWVNLQTGENERRANLKKKWRNDLNKAEKQELDIQWDDRGALYPWIMSAYLKDKAEKNYNGPSQSLMNALAGNFIPRGNMLIGRATKNDEILGGILLFCHGRSATYQIGWNSKAGRNHRAHHILLWEALKILKQRNINNLDLGGMNDETAANVKKFKSGLGGQPITLPGLYT